MRFLAIFIIFGLFIVFPVLAEDKPSFIAKFKNFILDKPLEKEFINPVRPTMGTDVNECVEVTPHDHISLMERVGATARHMANNLDARKESLSFQPHFSGLKGPKLTIMRRDLERALVTNQGSANEIYHNASFAHAGAKRCNHKIRHAWDIELNHHIDLIDSDKSPLVRSDIIVNERIHFGGYFLGTASLRHRLYQNLDRDQSLQTVNRLDPIRQDVFGFASQKVGLDRLMLSGFVTPLPDTHVAVHGGFLEEGFYGLGGEILYRPFDSAFAIGGEAWRTQKRMPYMGGVFTRDKNNIQTSALLNLWYDIPDTKFTLGLGGGRYLDGDKGIEARAMYKPANGWRIEGFATLSNEEDDDNILYSGIKLTMPLGQFKGLPNNSRQTFDFKPFARDKGQRINNPYPLYDLTNAWSGREIHQNWDLITAE